MNIARQFGPRLSAKGVKFRLWAPAARRVDILLDEPVPMIKRDAWFEYDAPQAEAGTLYLFRVDGELEIADPASQFQPRDVAGPSEVIDQAYAWKNENWKGRPWEDAVFLELHVGTFTPEGTYRAAIAKLEHLANAGITAIELMPVADFPGRWNWGYDGVLWFSPDSSYGRPEELKEFIDVAHSQRLMVFLDVVYNHFGPQGNYLGRIAPEFFSTGKTPWGGAINYDVPKVRQFAIENALYWLSEFRFDGLRFDAVHAITTPGSPHILHELSIAVGALARASGRHIHLVLENDDNRASLLDPWQDPPLGRYRAQWNDDYHHAWHVLLTGETKGYYKDYRHAAARVARSLREGFSYQGEASSHRGGRLRGEMSARLPPAAFVNFLQNHDQIGNRALGDRLTALAGADALHAARCVLLLAPSPPLLFMGEEWGATEPFPFFCDFHGDLADAVRRGRRAEFSDAYADPGIEVPDPLATQTRQSAVLDWSAISRPPFKENFEVVRSLLRVRGEKIVPLIRQLAAGEAEVSFENGLLVARWRSPHHTLQLVANLSRRPMAFFVNEDYGDPIWGGPPGSPLAPWAVHAAIASR